MIALVLTALLAADGGTPTEIEGVVVKLADHGAFVELAPGKVGLLHVDDMGWSGEKDPRKLVTLKQKVKVRIQNADPARPSLTMRDAAKDPWRTVAVKFPVGTFHKAQVLDVPVDGLGVFLRLAPWVDVFVHRSQLHEGKQPFEYRPGQTVEILVKDVDIEKRQIVGSMR